MGTRTLIRRRRSVSFGGGLAGALRGWEDYCGRWGEERVISEDLRLLAVVGLCQRCSR